MKREFSLSVEWRGVEIHPETPAEGMPMTARFRAADISRMMEHLRAMGAPYGITFVDRPILSNSRNALQAVEFARDKDKFQQFHEAIFASYFSQGLDIGDLAVLSRIAEDCGLDAREMADSIETGKYITLLTKAQEEAAQLGITGVPTFFIGEKKSIVGAQPLDVFRKVLRSV